MTDLKPIYHPYVFFLRMPNTVEDRKNLGEWFLENVVGTFQIIAPKYNGKYDIVRSPLLSIYERNSDGGHIQELEYENHTLILFENLSDALLFKLSYHGEIYGEEINR